MRGPTLRRGLHSAHRTLGPTFTVRLVVDMMLEIRSSAWGRNTGADEAEEADDGAQAAAVGAEDAEWYATFSSLSGCVLVKPGKANKRFSVLSMAYLSPISGRSFDSAEACLVENARAKK